MHWNTRHTGMEETAQCTHQNSCEALSTIPLTELQSVQMGGAGAALYRTRVSTTQLSTPRMQLEGTLLAMV